MQPQHQFDEQLSWNRPEDKSIDHCYMCGVAEKQFYSQEGYCRDCEELHERAKEALRQARHDGCLKQGYHPSSWREAKHRLEHAATHIYQYKRGDLGEDHLAHAICDLVMSYDKHDS